MEQMWALRINSELSFCINVQIKEQIKWLIATGNLRPGDMLPSAHQLADQLGLNRNTVNLVYTQLRDEGLLIMQKGRGTQVADSPKTSELRKTRTPMQLLVDQVIQDAAEKQISLSDFFIAGLAYMQLGQREPVYESRIALIVSRELEYDFYKAEVARLTRYDVHLMFLEDTLVDRHTSSNLLTGIDAVVTTLDHANEVRKLLTAKQTKPLITIGATADISMLLDIARLPKGAVVGFIAEGQKQAELMAARIYDAGIRQIEACPFDISKTKGLLELIAASDKLYVTPSVAAMIKPMAPDKIDQYILQLEKSSISLLENLVLR